MLYDVKNILAKIVIMPEYKEVKKDLLTFFNGDNLYNSLGLNEIYTHGRMPGIFIKEKDLIQLFMLAKNTFKLSFEISNFTEGHAAIKKVNENDENLKLHKVSSHEEVKNIVKKHLKESSYGKEIEYIKNNPTGKKAIRKQENKDFNQLKIVSIDFEFTLNKTDNTCFVTECGIAINNNGIISTQHYLIKENHLKKSKYAIARQKTFAFGETKTIEENSLPEILNTVLKDTDIVVFHEKREDNDILKNYGIVLENKKNITVMDTQWCYKKHFMNPNEKMVGIAIENLLEGFKIPYNDLHNAGNDAYYTLQLLLKMSQIYILRESLNQEKNINLENKPKM